MCVIRRDDEPRIKTRLNRLLDIEIECDVSTEEIVLGSHLQFINCTSHESLSVCLSTGTLYNRMLLLLLQWKVRVWVVRINLIQEEDFHVLPSLDGTMRALSATMKRNKSPVCRWC